MRRSSFSFIPFAAVSTALLLACSSSSDDEHGGSTSSLQGLAGSCAVPVDGTRSLFVTDATALAQFPLASVMGQIAATGNAPAPTALALYQQMVDTLNDKAHGTTTGPHCDDVLTNGNASIDGFPIECPRQEGSLSTTDPFGAGADGYSPVGIVNRFDLAPKNGSNCGQYRLVYGKNSGKTQFNNRMLLIFEAVLPNPNPAAGLTACLPVAQFWDNLSNDADATSRATKLRSFYFTGLSGFSPVIQAAHYGVGGGTDTGQIRANMFMNFKSGQQWELREFRLSPTCASTTCALRAINTSVATNPFGGLFGGTDPRSQAFQSAFLGQVSSLAARNVNTIAMSTPAADDAGESDEQDTSNDYRAQAQSNTPFRAQITSTLVSINRPDLSVDNILDRATTQSCAGCHQLSGNRGSNDLGAGLTWPASNGFTQIDESSRLSPAVQAFLTFRSTVLTNFINANCPATTTSATLDDGRTLGGSPIGAAN